MKPDPAALSFRPPPLPHPDYTVDPLPEEPPGPADLGDVFYAPLSAAGAADWGAWLRDWLRLLKAQGRIDGVPRPKGFPSFIWMPGLPEGVIGHVRRTPYQLFRS